MKDAESWSPSKFEKWGDGFRASRDPDQVQISSRLVADIQARVYAQLLRTYARGQLLDLGCGGVPLFEMYRDIVLGNTCIDWSNTSHSQRHIDIAHDVNEPLPLPDGGWDTLLLTDVLEHVRYPEQLFDEMVRVTKPGGCIIVTVPFMYWIHERPYDYHRFTEFKLAEFCAVRGLTLEYLQAYGGAPEVIVDLLSKVVRGSPWFCRFFTVLAQGFCRLPPVRLVSRNTRKLFPLGYALVARRPR